MPFCLLAPKLFSFPMVWIVGVHEENAFITLSYVSMFVLLIFVFRLKLFSNIIIDTGSMKRRSFWRHKSTISNCLICSLFCVNYIVLYYFLYKYINKQHGHLLYFKNSWLMSNQHVKQILECCDEIYLLIYSIWSFKNTNNLLNDHILQVKLFHKKLVL